MITFLNHHHQHHHHHHHHHHRHHHRHLLLLIETTRINFSHHIMLRSIACNQIMLFSICLERLLMQNDFFLDV